LRILVLGCIASGICGFVENGFSGLIESVSIAFAVVLVTLVTACNNYASEKRF
jgi:hypothetical protein